MMAIFPALGVALAAGLSAITLFDQAQNQQCRDLLALAVLAAAAMVQIVQALPAT